MTKLYNKKSKTVLRKKLRNNQTNSENILWKKLRRRQINNYKFRRQYSVGNYIVDFYCQELKLAIEVDGGSHFFDQDSINNDIERQKFIESFGIKFLRFTTTEIYYRISDVMEVIYKEINS